MPAGTNAAAGLTLKCQLNWGEIPSQLIADRALLNMALCGTGARCDV
jgi:hypothetical protein